MGAWEGGVIILLFAVACVVGSLSFSQSDSASLSSSSETDSTNLIILHTNDFHGNLEANAQGEGGADKVAWFIKQVRKANIGVPLLLLDGGDTMFSGPAISALVYGESTIEIFNTIGYNAAVIGNHELDKGASTFQDRVTQSTFPWLSANIILNGSNWVHPPWALPYKIFHFTGIDVGIIGLTTTQAPDIAARGVTDGLEFRELFETVMHYYDEVKPLCDFMLLLCHDGLHDVVSGDKTYQGLKSLAGQLTAVGKPVPLMIGAHDHLALQQPFIVDDTMICITGDKGRWVGQISVHLNGDNTHITGWLNVINATTCQEDPEVTAQIEYWNEQVAPVTEQIVGQTAINLTRIYTGESLLGDLITDSYLWAADLWDNSVKDNSVAMGFCNPGSFRADITCAHPECNVTWDDTYNVLPVANTLILMTLTGQQVNQVILKAAGLSYGMFQFSGVTFEWWHYDMQHYGVQYVKIQGADLNMSASYRVVTNSALVYGGDALSILANATQVVDSKLNDQASVNKYINDPQGIGGSPISIDKLHPGRSNQFWSSYSSKSLSSSSQSSSSQSSSSQSSSSLSFESSSSQPNELSSGSRVTLNLCAVAGVFLVLIVL
ncbi:bifunctional metallophosphatase/5'-nucleotidase [Pelomyxa schiedti]|nr:bifunctional metallophosphatase/5'-nucleotidase [Pelomyxa schiedti]